jgi:hypothetical protein
VALQDIPDRLIADLIARVGQRPRNPVIDHLFGCDDFWVDIGVLWQYGCEVHLVSRHMSVTGG